MSGNYLRELGVHPCTIFAVKQKPAGVSKKGKPFPAKIGICLRHDDGRMIDKDYPQPLPDWAKKDLKNLFGILAVSKYMELVGKKILVFVAPREHEGRTYWEPRGFYDMKHFVAPLQDLDLDSFGGAPGSTLPQVPEDDFGIPF